LKTPWPLAILAAAWVVPALAADPSDSPVPSSVSSDRRQPPIDWSKSVVSRGFGRNVSDQPLPEPARARFKEGEASYFFGDYARAREYWLPLAEQGYAEAQANLGWMAQRGLGAAANIEQAKKWYELAAAQGQAIAQNNLGALYEHGLGVSQDYAKAVTLYQSSAEAGYRYALFNLAQLYLQGLGVEKDVVKARYWLERAAAQGVAEARAQLKAISR